MGDHINGTPAPQQAPPPIQLDVGLLALPDGRRAVVLLANGRTITVLAPEQAIGLGQALIVTAGRASMPNEEMRKLLLASETGLVLPSA